MCFVAPRNSYHTHMAIGCVMYKTLAFCLIVFVSIGYMAEKSSGLLADSECQRALTDTNGKLCLY